MPRSDWPASRPRPGRWPEEDKRLLCGMEGRLGRTSELHVYQRPGSRGMAATSVTSVLLVAPERTGGSVSGARGNGCWGGAGGGVRGGRVPAQGRGLCCLAPFAMRDARVPEGERGGGREERICKSGKSASNSTCGGSPPTTSPSLSSPSHRSLPPAVGLSFPTYAVGGIAPGLPSFMRTSPGVGCQL